MGHKEKEIYYQCPTCKGTNEIVCLQLTGLRKKPALIRHICKDCNTHMVRHVVVLTMTRTAREMLGHGVMVRGHLEPNKEGTLTPK